MQCFTHTVVLVQGVMSLKHEASSHGKLSFILFSVSYSPILPNLYEKTYSCCVGHWNFVLIYQLFVKFWQIFVYIGEKVNGNNKKIVGLIRKRSLFGVLSNVLAVMFVLSVMNCLHML